MTKQATEDDYLQVVGQLIQNSSFADAVLLSVLSEIAGFDRQMARAIYHASDAFSVKERLLMRISKISCDRDQRDSIREIIAAARNTNKQRRELAHALLVDDPTKGLMRVNGRDEAKPATDAYLTAMENESEAALTECRVAYVNFCQLRGVQQKLLY